ncbi:hypothetical protein D3C76_1786770 [compost metagenome]
MPINNVPIRPITDPIRTSVILADAKKAVLCNWVVLSARSKAFDVINSAAIA